MLAVRSLVLLVGTLAVVAMLWLMLLSGGDGAPTATQGGTTAPATSGEPAAGGYGDAIGAADGAVRQANQDAQRAARSAAGTP
jgi:hypothetical protein